MASKGRQNILALAAALTIGGLAVDRLVLTPQLEAWDERANRIAQLERDVAKAAALAEREADWDARWNELLAQALPLNASAAESATLKAVNEWARQSRISLVSIKPRPIGADQLEWSQLEFRASGRGTLDGLARFLYLLESSPMGLRVEDMEITAREQDSRELGIELRFTGLLMAPSAAPPQAAEQRPAPANS